LADIAFYIFLNDVFNVCRKRCIGIVMVFSAAIEPI